MERWFTSDQHFDHVNIISFCDRPFTSVEQMNDEIINRWNSVVGDDDIVYVLGDFAMGHRGVSVPYAEKLKGTKFLVPGNHDAVWSGNPEKQVNRWMQVYVNSGLIVVDGSIELRLNDQAFKACHFPYYDIERHAGRFTDQVWSPEDDGETWLLHGHVHQAWQADRERRQINVGVDVWDFYPVHEGTVLEIVNERQ